MDVPLHLTDPQTTSDTATVVADGVVSSQTVTTNTGPTSAGWLSTNLRNGVVIALTVTVCWLAYDGVEQARTALVNGFMLLMGALWGERAALKVPNRDS